VNRKAILIGAIVTVPIIAVLAMSFGRDPREIRTPMVGRAAPSFILRDVATNEAVSLESFRGRPVVVNFWATWCAPCVEEHATLVATARALGSKVQVIGVVYGDTQDQAREFLERRGRAYPSVLDEGAQTAIAYGVYGVPETFFVNPEGGIAAKYVGPLTFDLLTQHLRTALR
jgi:cytochrome c biogenesis protein CcmG/thiol:disulfide interchange protein DsbE